jgi:hypothetical protein
MVDTLRMKTNKLPNITPLEPSQEALDIAARIFANRAKRLHQQRLAQQRLSSEVQEAQVKKADQHNDAQNS